MTEESNDAAADLNLADTKPAAAGTSKVAECNDAMIESTMSAKLLPAAAAAASVSPSLQKEMTTTKAVVVASPTSTCLQCIRRDLKRLYQDPLPGIFAAPASEQDATKLVALIIGPFDTPYEGGFFLFDVQIPAEYPYQPPVVTMLTTGGGRVRFNPNLYANGTVCLSILGTWNGPSWSPAQWIGSVLLSIQSLLCENPYFNEPGYELGSDRCDVEEAKRYNDMIRHEVIRAAVLGVVDPQSSLAQTLSARLPDYIRTIVVESFFDMVELYRATCQQQKPHDGAKFRDPFKYDATNSGLGAYAGTFHYAKLDRRLEAVQNELRAQNPKLGGK